MQPTAAIAFDLAFVMFKAAVTSSAALASPCLATCSTSVPSARWQLLCPPSHGSYQTAAVVCCKQAESILQKKQGLQQSFRPAEEADFTMQMVIAAIFKDKLLTSFRQGKNRQRKAINLLFSLYRTVYR